MLTGNSLGNAKKPGLLPQSLISVLCMYMLRFAGCHAPKLAPENLLRCTVKLLFKISPGWQTEGKLLFKITKANWYLKSAQGGTLQRCLSCLGHSSPFLLSLRKPLNEENQKGGRRHLNQQLWGAGKTLEWYSDENIWCGLLRVRGPKKSLSKLNDNACT